MQKPLRTFVAVEVTDEVRQGVARLVARLQATGASVRWVASKNVHLTLNFLGDVDVARTHEVCNAVAEAAAQVLPFELELRGAGAFPNVNRPRTLWVGVGSGAEQLGKLHANVEGALAQLGFPKEQRRFRGHLTIGRARQGHAGMPELAELLRKNEEAAFGVAPVREVLIFSSRLGREGAKYEALGHARLKDS